MSLILNTNNQPLLLLLEYHIAVLYIQELKCPTWSKEIGWQRLREQQCGAIK